MLNTNTDTNINENTNTNTTHKYRRCEGGWGLRKVAIAGDYPTLGTLEYPNVLTGKQHFDIYSKFTVETAQMVFTCFIEFRVNVVTLLHQKTNKKW